MIFGELIKVVGSKYATFRYAKMHIVDYRLSCVLYFALLKTKEVYEDDSIKESAKVVLPYMASVDEDKALLNHIKHFCFLREMNVLSNSDTTFLVKDIFEKELGEISEHDSWKTKENGLKDYMNLPFNETDIVKEFIFFDEWFFHAEQKREIGELGKEIATSLTTSFFERFFGSLIPVTDSWNTKGRVLQKDLEKLVFDTDLRIYHPGLNPAAGHIRDINVYDNDSTFVIRTREGVEAHEPELYIIENYHGEKTMGYLAYREMDSSYLLGRLLSDINGKSTDELETNMNAFISNKRIQADILSYLSDVGAKVKIDGYGDIELTDDVTQPLTHTGLENFRKTGRLVSVNLTDDNILTIKKQQAKLELAGLPKNIIGVTTPIKDDWSIKEIKLIELQFEKPT